MFEKEIIDQVRDHQGVERQQIASNKRFLESCEENDVPEELKKALQDSILCQEELLTTSEKVLQKMLSEKEERE